MRYLEAGATSDRLFWYLQAWKNALVPVCRQQKGGTFTDCTDFKPSFSNEGLCFTRNGGNFDEMFQPTTYSSTFKNIMLSGINTEPIKFNLGSGSQYKYTFLVDGHRQLDFKRGKFWNEKFKNYLTLASHSPYDIPDIKSSGVEIHPGYETTIRINIQELKSNPEIRKLSPNKRGCKFEDENGDLTIFKWYSKINFLFECRMKLMEKMCGCRPWDYPTDLNRSETSEKEDPRRICDYFGNICFHAMMQTDSGEKECLAKGYPDCNSVQHSFSIEKTHFEVESVCQITHKARNYYDPKAQDRQNSIRDFDEMLESHVAGFPQSPPKWGKIYPITRLERIAQNLMQFKNRSMFNTETCKKRIMNDIAVVNIVVNNPTVLRFIQTNRVSLSDKIASFGTF